MTDTDSRNGSRLNVVVKIQRLSDWLEIQLHAVQKRNPQETVPKWKDTERMKVNVQKLHYTKANEKKARVVPLILGGKKTKNPCQR